MLQIAYYAEPTFSCSGSMVKQCTPEDLVTRAIDKILGEILRFLVKCCSKGKVQYLVFSNFLLVLTIYSFWEEDWTLDYNYMEFWDFLKSNAVWQLVSQLVFTIFITNNHALLHLLWKKNLVRYFRRVTRNFLGQGSFLGIRALW